jgi:anti-sigma regulatory factor (Ser/Thr protein kinase)
MIVNFTTDDKEDISLTLESEDDEEYSLMIAQILMDQLEINPKEGCVVSMMKYIAEND